MPVLSLMRRSFPLCQSLGKVGSRNAITVQLRNHGDEKMFITPSRWAWHKFKDYLHFYVMLGAIPLTALSLYVNIFIGPAQLAPIPEGYIPEEYEYYKHPISRWFQKHIYVTQQELYEKYLHVLYHEKDKQETRLIENKVLKLMRERGDSKFHYYRPPVLKYLKDVREAYDFRREYESADE